MIILLVLSGFATQSVAAPVSGTTVTLPVETSFSVVDPVRELLFLSAPEDSRIRVYSLDTLQALTSISVGGVPQGLAISEDGESLLVAVGTDDPIRYTGKIRRFDLNGNRPLVETINLPNDQGIGTFYGARPYSLLLRNDGKILVSARIGSSPLVSIDTVEGNAISTIGIDPYNNRPIVVSGSGLLTQSPDGSRVYVFTNEYSSKLFELDGTQPGFPLLRKIDQSGYFKPSRSPLSTVFSVSDDGRWLFLPNGEVVDSTTLEVVFTDETTVALTPSSANGYVAGINTSFTEPSLVSLFAGNRPGMTGSHPFSDCQFTDKPRQLHQAGSAESWIVLARSVFDRTGICFLTTQDTDSDGHADLMDNCPSLNNPAQLNYDLDSLGDACDPDDDDDRVADEADVDPLNPDSDGDGAGDYIDRFPLNSAASLDTDLDGNPDEFHPDCDTTCMAESGLIEDLDDDEDSIPDVSDPQQRIPDQQTQRGPPSERTNLEVGGEVFDIEIDEARSLIYYSIPSTGSVKIAAQRTLRTLATIEFDGEPRGVDLSLDGATLYVALAETGTLGAVDLLDPALAYTEVDVSAALAREGERPRQNVFDVAAGLNGQAFVTAGTSSHQQSHIVMVTTQPAPSVKRVARTDDNSLKTLSRQGYLQFNPASASLFIHAYDLTRLSVGAIDAPVIRETPDADGSSFGYRIGSADASFQLSADSSRLYSGRGHIVNAETLRPISRKNYYDLSIVDPRNDVVAVFNDSGLGGIELHDIHRNYQTGHLRNPCGPRNNSLYLTQASTVIYNEGYEGWFTGFYYDGSYGPAEYQLCYVPLTDEAGRGYPAPGASFDPSDYFPLQPALTRYFTSEGASGDYSSTVESKITTINGHPTRGLNYTTGQIEYYSADDEGVYLHGSKESDLTVTYSPPIRVTPERMINGEETRQDIAVLSKPRRGKALNLDLEVTTKIMAMEALTFPGGAVVDAYKIRQNQRYFLDGNYVTQINQTYWLAENIGVARVEALGEEVSVIPPADFDGDLIDDRIDPDDDGDGVPDLIDAFPYNPGESVDNDRDGIGDNEDFDDDNDTFEDTLDNCPMLYNPDQIDTNSNGFGDLCDCELQLINIGGKAFPACL